MKQHVSAEQLTELNYEERLTLIAFVTGLEKNYAKEEYKKGKKDEEDMLRSYGYYINIGQLIEIIFDYTGQFPTPITLDNKYAVKISWKNDNGETVEFFSGDQVDYCDALYEIVKQLLNNKYVA
jgi:hypothetical protein